MTFTKIRDPMTGQLIEAMILRADGAHIPADPANTDWQAYQVWRAAGNTPAAPSPAKTGADERPGQPSRNP